MSRSISSLCFLGLLATALCACGNNDTNNDTSAPSADEAIRQGVQLQGELACVGAYECPENGPISAAVLGRYGDLDTCIANISDAASAQDPDALIAAVDDGSMTYDAAQGAACLDALRALRDGDACAIDNGLDFGDDHPCTLAVQGATATGDACILDAQCSGDMRCIPSDSGDACSATCQPGGDECGDTRCSADETCVDGTTCQAKGELGEPCTTPEQCIGALTCSFAQSDMGSGVCVEPGSAEEGEGCDNDVECVDGTTCEPSPGGKICTTRPAFVFNGMGEPCAGLFESPFCQPGLVCNDLTFNSDTFMFEGTCGPPQPQGAACDQYFQCAYDLQCEGADLGEERGTCEALRAVGSDCSIDLECATGVCDYPDDATVGACAAPISAMCSI